MGGLTVQLYEKSWMMSQSTRQQRNSTPKQSKKPNTVEGNHRLTMDLMPGSMALYPRQNSRFVFEVHHMNFTFKLNFLYCYLVFYMLHQGFNMRILYSSFNCIFPSSFASQIRRLSFSTQQLKLNFTLR